MSQPIRGQGGYLVFPIGWKHKLGRGRWDLASYQVLLNSVQRFQRRSRKYLSQSEDRVAILFFRSARKTQTWLEDVEILLPVKFRWIPFSGWNQRRSRKCEKLTTTDGRRKDDGQRMIPIVHLSLRPRCTKNATKNFYNTTIAGRLRTVSWSNSSQPNWCG